MPVRTTPAQIRKMFRLTVTEMEHQIGQFVKRPGKDFTRHRQRRVYHVRLPQPGGV